MTTGIQLSLKNKTMETNNNNNINIPLTKGVLVTENIPFLEEEIIDLLEVEAQNTESASETAMVIPKENKEKQHFSIKHIFQSLFYAMQWAQLKRQLTKDAFVGMAKRHWSKAIAIATVVFLFNLNFGQQQDNQANILVYDSRGQETVVANIIETDFGTSSSQLAVVSEKAKENYIVRFSSVAQGEMEKFNIPASVILGLSILHSNYGASELAQNGNNHFHITCTDNHLAEGIIGRGMHEGECYVHYQNAWTSFRANSLKLNAEHFEELKAVAGKNYQTWVSGLQKMGLQESDHLLEIIEQHELYKFDNNK